MLEQCAVASFGLTAKVMLWSTLLHLTIGLGLGWLMARRYFYGKAILDALIMLPLIFPPIVLGYVLLLALGRNGWLMHFLPDWLRPDIVFSLPALVIAAFVAGLPLMVKPVQTAFMAVPQRMREAAATLGEPPWRVFWRVDWPLARRGIVTGLMLSGGRALGEVGISLTLGGNISGRTETLSLAIYNHVLDGEFYCANHLSFVLVGMTMMVFFILKRYGTF